MSQTLGPDLSFHYPDDYTAYYRGPAWNSTESGNEPWQAVPSQTEFAERTRCHWENQTSSSTRLMHTPLQSSDPTQAEQGSSLAWWLNDGPVTGQPVTDGMDSQHFNQMTERTHSAYLDSSRSLGPSIDIISSTYDSAAVQTVPQLLQSDETARSNSVLADDLIPNRLPIPRMTSLASQSCSTESHRHHCDVEGCTSSFSRASDHIRHMNHVHAMGKEIYVCAHAGCGYSNRRQDKMQEHCRKLNHESVKSDAAAWEMKYGACTKSKANKSSHGPKKCNSCGRRIRRSARL